MAGITDVQVLVAAILHDTIEDTDTTVEEIRSAFGVTISDIVEEVTDDKNLPKDVRKKMQIEHAATSSRRAKLVKLADKICNLRDLNISAPPNWSLERIREYFEWANNVVENLRGISPDLEAIFDDAYSKKPN